MKMSLSLQNEGNNELRSYFEETGLLSLLPTEEECFSDTEKLFSWLQTAPKFTTYRVNTLLTTSILVAKALVEELKKQAASRWGNPPPPQVLVHPLLPELVVVGCWDATHLSLEPRPRQVIVDEACGAAVLRGAHVFAAGVMGVHTGVHIGDLVSVYADVNNRCRRGLSAVLPTGDSLFVGNGVARMERRQLFGKDPCPSGVAVEMTDAVSGCPALTSLPPSSALLQNLPSVVCVRALDPRPGDAVLDLCAAPGNKTSHLAALMRDTGVVVALDKTASKVKAIERRCEQFGISCVRAFACDSRRAATEGPTGGAEGGPPFPPDSFDKVLLDAPCSGLGRRPLLGNKTSRSHVQSYPPLQRALFHTAVTLLRPGGSLVYSTCTVTVAENEGIVAWALETFPALTLVPAEPVVGQPGWRGSSLDDRQRKCVQRFGPPVGPDCDTDNVGFFIAHFVKA